MISVTGLALMVSILTGMMNRNLIMRKKLMVMRKLISRMKLVVRNLMIMIATFLISIGYLGSPNSAVAWHFVAVVPFHFVGEKKAAKSDHR
jgi:hypothetical protein